MRYIKKLALMGISLACMCTSVVASTIDVSVNLNGEYMDLANGGVYIEEGRTMVPLRVVTESIGALVEYDDSTKGIVISKDDQRIILKLNTSKAIINNEEIEMSVVPVMKDEVTMVPLRFVSETLGVYVYYDANRKTIYLSTLEYNVPEDIVSGYMKAIELVYEIDPALNDDITYVAFDCKKMRYLSEEGKQALVEKMGVYGTVIESDYETLKKQGMITKGYFENGIIVSINDFYSEGNQLILGVDKWRSSLGAIGSSEVVLENNNGKWEIINKVIWYIS